MGIEVAIHSSEEPQVPSLDSMESQTNYNESEEDSDLAVVDNSDDSFNIANEDKDLGDMDSSYESDDSNDENDLDDYSIEESSYHDDNSELSEGDDDDDDDDDNSMYSLEQDDMVTMATSAQRSCSNESISESTVPHVIKNNIQTSSNNMDDDIAVSTDFIRDEPCNKNGDNQLEDADELPIINDNPSSIQEIMVDYDALAQVVFANMKGMNDHDLERIIELSLRERERRMMVEHNANAGVSATRRHHSRDGTSSERKHKSSRSRSRGSSTSVTKHRSNHHRERSTRHHSSKSDGHESSSSQRTRRRRRRKKKPMTFRRFVRRTRRAFRKSWTFKMTLSVLFGTVTLIIGVYVLTLFIKLIAKK